MRPIELELSGLHSYRGTVHVDFEHLGEHGVFGIFGSIGSGKSTLLDGLTLALYGIVDRVSSRSRQGIVNHHSRQIEVRLRFSISPSGEPEVFEVHRIYRRTKTGGAERVNSRISRIEGDHAEVLADKEREVNQAIEQLLGLNATDFMRAVVLPQGRFMRFLHLKGVDRRQMLQRIFRLSAFGEGLRKQIRTRREKLNLALEGRRGQLSGIGDASEQAIEQAAAEVVRADHVLNEATAAFDVVEEAWQQAKAIRERQQRLARAEAALAEHLEARAAIDMRKAALDLADQAHALQGPSQASIVATERLERARTAHELAAAGAVKTSEALEALETARAKAEADRLAGAPGLQERQIALSQAVGQAQELQETRALCVQLTADRDAARERAQKANTALETLEAGQAENQAERQRLTERLTECQVPREQREHLQEVVRAHDHLMAQSERRQAAEKRLADIRNKTEAATTALAEAEVQQTRSLEHRQALEAQLAELPKPVAIGDPAPMAAALQSWEHASNAVQAAQTKREASISAVAATRSRTEEATTQLKRAQTQCRQMEAQLSAAEAALIALQRQHSASVLAGELEDDEPCPVCGSTDHPSPAERVQLDDTPVVVLQAASDRARAWREAAGEQVAALAARLDAALADEQTAVSHLQLTREQLTEAETQARGTLPDSLAWLSDPTETRTAFEAWQTDARAHAADLQARRDALTEAVTAAKVEEERASAPVAAARASLGAAGAANEQAQAELEALREAEGAAWAAFDEVKGGITLFDVKRLQADQARRDQESHELLPRLQALERDSSVLEADIHAARADAAASSGDLVALEDTLRANEKRCQQLERDVGLASPDAPPAEALEATKRRLSQLEQAVTDATEARDAARTQSLQATQLAAEARSELQAATEADTTARRRLQQVLSELGLAEDVDVKPILAAALTEAQRSAERAAISAWATERIARQAAVESARSELGEDAVDARAFETLDAKRQSAMIMLDVSRSAAHRASHHHDDLIARAERFATLSSEVEDFERQLARLDQLARLVRGDRFVDFLANDYLAELVREANRYLHRLTDERYTLVLGKDATFEIQDADGGGSVRPVHTLSGGETFMASLALALALSTQVQARSSHPLEFFFLDEGFGSLDAEALDRVMGAIESLRDDARTIGLISHVAAVRERVPRYLEVSPPGRDGTTGSTISVRDN